MAPGATLNFNPDSTLGGTSSLDTTFPTIELSVDAIMELSGSVSGEGCLLALGCTIFFNETFDIDERAPILSFNEDGEGGILLLGQDPSFFGLPSEADGFPVDLPAGDFATITLHLPQPDASGGLNATGDKLEATGQDDLVDLLVDIDQIVTAAAGVPGLLGTSIPIPPNGELGFDIINVEMGPTVDLQQDFELTPTLFVRLVFDQAVMIGGELVEIFEGAWDLLPDITFLADETIVTPTFFLDAALENSTLLDFDLAFIIDLLQINFDLPFLGFGETSFGIGNVLDEAVDLFDTPDIFNNLFPLIGFNALQAPSFVIDFIDGSSGPETDTTKTIVNNANVPEPGTLFLFLIGLGLLIVLRRRREFGQMMVITTRGLAAPAA
ncbi:MAG: PEP-CTERM sorting domain-containing protein [Gammaproteobacteria bacterium]|nr:PEP-CTERM sorting domain-containing protein [Gammaproteobacteria bacterium]